MNFDRCLCGLAVMLGVSFLGFNLARDYEANAKSFAGFVDRRVGSPQEVKCFPGQYRQNSVLPCKIYAEGPCSRWTASGGTTCIANIWMNACSAETGWVAGGGASMEVKTVNCTGLLAYGPCKWVDNACVNGPDQDPTDNCGSKNLPLGSGETCGD